MSSSTYTMLATATTSTLVSSELTNDRGPAVFVVSLIVLIFASLFVFMRMISKGFIVRKLSLDDWVTLLAWICSAFLSVSVMIGTRYGLGKPDSMQPAEWTPILTRTTYGFTVLYNPCLMLTKTAILILYVRMSAAHPLLRWASIATMTVVNLSGTVLTFLNLFRCRPIKAGWDSNTEGQCIDVIALYLSSAPISVITDLAILLVPLPILTSLRLEFRQKVVLVTTFVVGGFVAIVDVVRIAYLQNALKEDQRSGDDDSGDIDYSTNQYADVSYHVSFALMWSTVEVCVGLMCCCVLVLKPLVMRFIPAMLRDKVGHPSVEDIITPTLETFQLSVLPHTSNIYGGEGQCDGGGSPISIRNQESEVDSGKKLDGVISQQEDDGEIDFFQMLASGPQQNLLLPIPSPPPQTSPTAQPNGPVKGHNSHTHSRAGVRHSRRQIQVVSQPHAGQEPTQTFFDFVNMGGKKSLMDLTAREAWWPVLFTSSLFFLWGFSYGLLGTLNSEIQTLLNYSASRSFALHNAYWLGYFIGPLVLGYPILKRSGFKATFMSGLAVFSVGAIAFWPSAILRSYAGFFISNFLSALGLSMLETAANPFIALAGPSNLSEARLNFSQGIQALGALLSPILADKVLFRHITARDLFRIQWCYLAVGIFVLFLAIVFFYVPLSEADDDELEANTMDRLIKAGVIVNNDSDSPVEEDKSRGPTDTATATRIKSIIVERIRLIIGIGGIFMIWTYVGSQETIKYFWKPMIHDALPHASMSAFWDQVIGEGLFSLGRFLASFFLFLGLKPRHVLNISILGCLITAILGMVLERGKRFTVGMFILHMFFESTIFPTAFALTLKSQGRQTKFISALMSSAISGALIFPSIGYGINTLKPDQPRLILWVVVAIYIIEIGYLLYINLDHDQKRKFIKKLFLDHSPKERNEKENIERNGNLNQETGPM